MSVHVDINHRTINRMFGANGPLAVELYGLGLRVQSTAKRLCPVDTGRLRSSIQTTPPFDEGDHITVSVGTNVEYAIFVHNGTRYMRGRPFLTQALQRES